MNATALWTADKCEVWTETQNAETALAAAAAAAGIPVGKCDVYRMHLGGGFGRRASSHDYVTQAVQIAKQMPGVPIKLIWSREEDMTHGRYHPITQCKLTGGLDAKATSRRCTCAFRVSRSWRTCCRNCCGRHGPVRVPGAQPQGPEGQFGYTIPNLLIDHAMRNTHITPGFWRGVNNNQNAIYLECFMDEIAHAAGQDPLEFRRKLMANHPKHLAVLNAVAEKAGWGKPAPEGVFRGVAQHMGYGSYVAAVAEVSVNPEDNEDSSHRRSDQLRPCGKPAADRERRSKARSFTAFRRCSMQECTVKDGRIEQENFDTYNCMRIARDAEGRIDRHAVGRLLGRRGRTDDFRRGTCRAQCDLCGDGQAHSQHAAEESGHRRKREPCGAAGDLGPPIFL